MKRGGLSLWQEFKLAWHWVTRNPRCDCGHFYNQHGEGCGPPGSGLVPFCDGLDAADMDCQCQNYREAP